MKKSTKLSNSKAEEAVAGKKPKNVDAQHSNKDEQQQKLLQNRNKRKKEDEKPMTKRQRRAQPNDQHLWPQQPKIKSAETRAKAYVRVAGLNTKNAKEAPFQLDPHLDIDSPSMKFGRLLASTNQRIRHAAILQMSEYLKARTDVNNEMAGMSELDLLKLWKGIWHCVYMADKVPVQEELSAQIASLLFSVAGTEEEDEYAGQAYMDVCGDDDESENSDDEMDDEESGENDDSVDMQVIENTLEGSVSGDDDEEEDDSSDDNNNEIKDDVEDEDENESVEDEIDRAEVRHCRGAHLASLFVRTFFRTIRREWGNMDKYRVDKFYTLMRDMMNSIYTYMAIRHWNAGIIRLFNDALYEEVFSEVPNGLRLHLIDVALDEMAKVNATKAPLPLTEATFMECFEPFFGMAQTGAGGNDAVHTRVLEQFLEKFLLQYSVVSDNAILKEKKEKTKEQGDSENDKGDNENDKGDNENDKGDNENDKDESGFTFDDVHVGTIADFIFGLASDAETSDRYRKSLYDLHKQYVRRLKEVGRDVEIEEDEDEDGELEDDGEEAGDAEDHSENKMDVEESNGKAVEEDEDATPNKSKKKKKKKKKKKVEIDKEQQPTGEKSEEAKISSTKNDKKKDQDQEKKKDEQAESSLAKTTDKVDKVDDDAPSSSKKRKKKKKRKDSDASDTSNQEEEILISIQDQKAAKKALKTKDLQSEEKEVSAEKKNGKKKKKKSRDSGSEDEDGNKRVKFGDLNRARSWKASMKNLRKMDTPISKTTPEKGILLNKDKVDKAQLEKKSKKNRRKKAVDYF